MRPTLKQFCYGCILALSALWVASTVALPSSAARTAFEPEQPASVYLDQANQSDSPSRETLLLKAADRYLVEGHPERASQLLQHLQPSVLSPIQRMQRRLVMARLLLNQERPGEAIEFLLDLPVMLPSDILREKQRLLALAYRQQGDWIESTKQLIQLDPYLKSPVDRLANHRQIWRNLLQVPVHTLDAQRQSLPLGVVKGWVDLAYLVKRDSRDPKVRAADLAQWHSDYPAHPAETILHQPEVDSASDTQNASRVALGLQPTELVTTHTAAGHALQIGVLLPMTGPMASSAEAIEKGFLAAYYQAKKAGPAPKLHFYNTHVGAVVAYQKAVEEGADLIVGPLLKSNVQALLSSTRLDKPTLTLNYAPDSLNTSANVYQFALSPADEVQQAAMHAWQGHHTNALVITSDNAWGQKAAATFSQTWTEHGGTIAGHLSFPEHNITQALRDFLGIQASRDRARALRRVLRKSFEFVPQRRQDFDMIFLASNAPQARQIVPLLKYYFAGQIPVYATSAVYAGKQGEQNDINHVMFCDMPWALNATPEIVETRAAIAKTWPNVLRRSPRLFAFGMDAYHLASKLTLLPTHPNLSGYTGELVVDNNGRVHRELLWAIVKDGQVQQLKR